MRSKFIVLTLAVFALSGCAEMELASHVAKTAPIPAANKTQGYFKVGSPYRIAGKKYYPKESYTYEETGIASWYGPNFHGKKTANGETFDMYELTAAHRTLQMPSLVRVTNLENGRSIVVRINDRGPFSKGRIIDMSKRGAELLGFKNQGTAKVKVQVLSKESREIADAAKRGYNVQGTEIALNKHVSPISTQPQNIPRAQPAVARSTPVPAPVPQVEVASVPGHLSNDGRFYPDPVVQNVPVSPTGIFVQAGSFGNAANAERFAKTLSAAGNAHVQPTNIDGRSLYRVRIGPMNSVPEADDMLARLASIGHDAIVVVD